MVNDALRSSNLQPVIPGRCVASNYRCAIAHLRFVYGDPGMSVSLPINRLRIKQPVRVHEREARATLACVDLAIKAGTPAGVTGGAGLLDPDPDRILIAI